MMSVRGSLVPDLRGGKARDLTMSQFLAGLIGDEEKPQWDPYDENDPSCCSSRAPKVNDADFPFADYCTANFSNIRTEPPKLTLDQFVQGMNDDDDDDSEEEKEFPSPPPPSTLPQEVPKKTKKTSKKKVEPEPVPEPELVPEEESDPVDLSTENVSEEGSLANKAKVPNRKGKKRGRKVKPTPDFAESASKKVRPTPPSSPSVRTDMEE